MKRKFLPVVAFMMGVRVFSAPVAHAEVVQSGTGHTVAGVLDTGAFAPLTGDFSRFTVPGMCVAAVRWATQIARHGVEAQARFLTLRAAAPERDSLPPEATALARACGRRFTLETTASSDLPALQTLTLAMGDDNAARAVVNRQLTLAKTGAERQILLKEAVDLFIAAAPARLAGATWAAAKADSFALADRTNSLYAHTALLKAAVQAFDRPRMVQEAQTLIRIGRELHFDAIKYYNLPLIEAWEALLTVAFFEHPDSILAVAARARADLRRFPSGAFFPPGVAFNMKQLFDFDAATAEQVRDRLLPFTPARYAGANALPPVEAPYWFPAKPTAWPPHGQVTLLLYGGAVLSCSRGEDWLLADPLRKECAPLYTYLRDWTSRFGPRGFGLILVERTSGEAVRSVPLTQTQEADSVHWYYRTYLNYPATTVAVIPRVVAGRAPQAADGRFWSADVTAFGRLLAARSPAPAHSGVSNSIGFAVLYDRQGRLVYAGERTFLQGQGPLLEALILRALAAPASTAASPASSTLSAPL